MGHGVKTPEQQRGDHRQANHQTAPDTNAAQRRGETEPDRHRKSDQPVADEGDHHWHGRILKAAQRTVGHALSPIDQLEQRTDAQIGHRQREYRGAGIGNENPHQRTAPEMKD